MHYLFRVSEVWHDPAPHVSRAAALIATVVLVEAAAFGAREAFAADPFLLLGAARGVEGILLFFMGPWTLKGPDRQAAARRTLVLALAIGACGIGSLALWKALIRVPPPGMPVHLNLTATGWPAFLFTTSIASPVAEELVFRGILYRSMRRRWSFPASTAAVSIAFAGLHLAFGGPFALPFLGSLIFCGAYEKEKLFLAPVLLHMIGNAIIYLSPLFLG